MSNTKKKREPIKTTHKQIVDYWDKNVCEEDLSVDFAEAHERCWRCGCECKLHRCHIIPHSLGGVDNASNLVLLCNRCHREAPNVNDVEFFWEWLKAQKTPCYDMYWIKRAIGEYKDIYNESVFEIFVKYEMNFLELIDYITSQHKDVAIHFGEGKLNPSTIAWLIKEFICIRIEEYKKNN